MLKVTGISPKEPNQRLSLQYYTPKQLAELLCVSPSLLGKLRINGKGPKYVKIGYRSVLYPVFEVAKHLDSLLQKSTSEDSNKLKRGSKE